MKCGLSRFIGRTKLGTLANLSSARLLNSPTDNKVVLSSQACFYQVWRPRRHLMVCQPGGVSDLLRRWLTLIKEMKLNFHCRQPGPETRIACLQRDHDSQCTFHQRLSCDCLKRVCKEDMIAHLASRSTWSPRCPVLLMKLGVYHRSNARSRFQFPKE